MKVIQYVRFNEVKFSVKFFSQIKFKLRKWSNLFLSTSSSVGTEQEVHQYSHQISECTPNLAPHYEDEEIWWERWIKKRRLSSQREIWHSPLISLLASPFALLSHRLRKSIPNTVSIPQNLPGYQRATFYTSYFIYENAWLNNNCFDHLATH